MQHYFTHNNHFKFGYNGEWFTHRQAPEDQWQIAYGACEREPGTFKEECYATARLIKDTTNEPLTVLFSGGADSEVIIRSFAEQKIPVSAAICQFNDNLNFHDISYAIICCEQLGVPYKLIPLNVLEFLEGKYLEYAEPIQMSRFGLCSAVWLAEQIDDIPIMGGGDCHLVKRGHVPHTPPYSYDPSPWDLYELERFSGWYRYFTLPGKERRTVPKFFKHTPEIMLSFLKDKLITNLVNDKCIGSYSVDTEKLKVYKKHFTLSDRPKYHGFEHIDPLKTAAINTDLVQRFPHSSVFLTDYDNLVDLLEGRTEENTGKNFLEKSITSMSRKRLLYRTNI